jgi:hypothetical protein
LHTFRYYLLFFMIRSFFEVVYWINHQVAQRDYIPPLPKWLSHLGPNEAAIVYQLVNMIWVIVSLSVFIFTFVR